MPDTQIEGLIGLAIDASQIRSRLSLGLREAGEPVKSYDLSSDLDSILFRTRPSTVLVGGHAPAPEFIDRIDKLSLRHPQVTFILLTDETLPGDVVDVADRGVAHILPLSMSPRDLTDLLPTLKRIRPPLRKAPPLTRTPPPSRSHGQAATTSYPETGSNSCHILGSSPIAKRLRERVREAAGFARILLLRGEEGVEFEAVVRALHESSTTSPSYPLILSKAEISTPRLTDLNASLCILADCEIPVVYLAEIEELAPHEREALIGFFESTFNTGKRHLRIVLGSVLNSFHADAQSDTFVSQIMPWVDEELVIPPLRERRDDIPEILRDTLYSLTTLHSILNVREIEPEAISYLSNLEWRGNTEELISRLRSAAASCAYRSLTLSHLRSLRLDDSNSAQMLETSADQIFFENEA